MNSLGVGVSTRSDNFPAVVQHDTVLKPVDCGGPVVDLSGKVVGVNIAHAGRTETYCLPADVLIDVMYDLMSGRLSPAVVEAAEKAKAEKDAAEMKATAEKMATEKKAAEEKAAAAKKAAAEKTVADLTARVEKLAAELKAAIASLAAKEKAAQKEAPQQRPDEKKPTDKK